jgi:hypothetical protein
LVIMLHIYLHAAWYAWWLGLSTFGMRGLSISGIVVIPLLLKLMSEREERGKSNKALVTLIFIANLWSYAILTQGTSQYYTYQELFSGIIAACENLVAINAITLPATVLVLGSLAKLLRFPKPFSSITVTIILTTVLLLLVTIYQITQLYFASGGMLVVSLMSLVAMLVILNGYPVVIEEFQKHCHLLQKIFFAVSAICFIAISIIFTNLSVVTNRIIASKVPASREYARISKFNIDEVKITYNEYLNVPGFDDKKTRLADFIYMVENSPAQLR